MTERIMARIVRIDDITPIPDADVIVAASVGGWKVVVKKDEFSVGELAIFCEIDSWIPTVIASFLSKGKEPSVYNGVKGEKLRTIRLKKQLSQGLLLPTTVLTQDGVNGKEYPFIEGSDVSELLNIQKYEAPVHASLTGVIKGNFPSVIPKTDQQRIQNLSTELEFWKEKEFTWEISEKIDGSSMTVYLLDSEFGVCSRNFDLKRDENNSLWKVAIRDGFEQVLRDYGHDIAIQGEIIGSNINGNIYKMNNHEYYIFDIYDIKVGRYFTPTERKEFVTKYNLKHVPVFKSNATLGTMTELLQGAEGKSVMGDINGPEREGLVYKCNECGASFKVISNNFLLKSKD